MQPMTWEEFLDFYESNGRTPTQQKKPNRLLNENQLRTKYDKYLKSVEKEEARRQRLMAKVKSTTDWYSDEEWEQVKAEVFKRDHYDCQLLEVLNNEELTEIKNRAGKLFLGIVDPAHVFGKGAYPHMRYDPDNIIIINRYSHSLLDNRKHPVYGRPLTAEEHEGWWRRILGNKRYDRLLQKSKQKGGT